MSERSQYNGSSIKNRQRGHLAHRTKIENLKRLNATMFGLGAALSAYETFQIKTYGGIVERTVIRIPFNKSIEPEEISFDQAKFECSGFAELKAETDNEFGKWSGKQIAYLLKLNDLFLYPSRYGAFAELLDAGVTIKTQKALYRLATRRVIEN